MSLKIFYLDTYTVYTYTVYSMLNVGYLVFINTISVNYYVYMHHPMQ